MDSQASGSGTESSMMSQGSWQRVEAASTSTSAIPTLRLDRQSNRHSGGGHTYPPGDRVVNVERATAMLAAGDFRSVISPRVEHPTPGVAGAVARDLAFLKIRPDAVNWGQAGEIPL